MAPDGVVYALDSTPGIQKFTPSGTFLSSWGSNGTGDGQFGGIFDVAVDPFGNIFVCDSGNDRIQKFAYTATTTRSATWGRLKLLYR